MGALVEDFFTEGLFDELRLRTGHDALFRKLIGAFLLVEAENLFSVHHVPELFAPFFRIDLALFHSGSIFVIQNRIHLTVFSKDDM